VYAVLGPFTKNQSQTLKTHHELDEDPVEYAKINYIITVPQNPICIPASSAEKTAKSDKGKSFSFFSGTYIPSSQHIKALAMGMALNINIIKVLAMGLGTMV
jgi:hypothetical protein